MKMTPPDLAGFRALVWEEVADTTSPRAGFGGLTVLASVDAQGRPQQRQVVIRNVSVPKASIEVFTDSSSAKIYEIQSNDNASILLWNAEKALQIRLVGRMEVDLEAAAAIYDRLPDLSKLNYGMTPPPGHEIDSPLDYTRNPSAERLVVLRLAVDDIDAVCLAEPRHFRAGFSRSDGWAGRWLAP